MNATSSILQDLDIERTLQCPVCYEVPPKIIYMCKIGHHMCERCRLRLTTCPTCQSAITGCRNFLGESLTNKFSVLINGGGDASESNNNLDDAINTVVTDRVARLALNQCQLNNVSQLRPLSNPSGLYKCFLESCRNRKEWGVSHMIKHVENMHVHLFDKFQNTTATFKHKFENFCFKKGVNKFHRAFQVSNMGLFFLNLETVSGGYINCWVSTPAPVSRCDSIFCQIVFSKEDCNKTEVFTSKVASNHQEKLRVFETGRVFVITPESHELSDHQFFNLNVKLVYKPPVSLTSVIEES